MWFTLAALLALSPPQPTLTVVTWNVLGSNQGGQPRLDAVVAELKAANADVIVLQEVEAPQLERLAAADWARHYHVLRGGLVAPGGLFVMSRRPIVASRVVRFPSLMGRVGLVVTVDVGGPMSFATGHLDSLLHHGPQRAAQLTALLSEVAGSEDSVVLGDLNFGDGEEPESGALDPRWRDVWRKLSGTAAGLTWNKAKNPLAAKNSFATEPSRRLDRVLLRSSRWTASGIRMIGTTWDASVGPPSDHFGLRFVLARRR